MRYVIQFLIPALIVLTVALIVLRNRPASSTGAASDNPFSVGTLIVILMIGSALAVGLVLALQSGG